MPTSTYTPIYTNTLGSSSSSITISSIPTTYTDLILVIATPSVAGPNCRINVGNGSTDTGSNYSFTQLYGDGSSAASLRQSNQTWGYGGVLGANSNTIIQFQNYSNTTTNKTWIARGSAPGAYVDAVVNLWRSTAAINRIQVTSDTAGTYAVGTTLTLYGIKAE